MKQLGFARFFDRKHLTGKRDGDSVGPIYGAVVAWGYRPPITPFAFALTFLADLKTADPGEELPVSPLSALQRLSSSVLVYISVTVINTMMESKRGRKGCISSTTPRSQTNIEGSQEIRWREEPGRKN